MRTKEEKDTTVANLLKLQGQRIDVRKRLYVFFCIAYLLFSVNTVVFAAKVEKNDYHNDFVCGKQEIAEKREETYEDLRVEMRDKYLAEYAYRPRVEAAHIELSAIDENLPTVSMSYVELKTAYDYSEEELLAMYQTVQAEAGGESIKGKTAVAAVILNRFFGDNAFHNKDSIVSIIKSPNQFSSTNYSLEWFEENNPEVIEAVNYAIQGYDPTAELYPDEGALFFYADWNNGEYGQTIVVGKAIVIDRQAYYQ